MEDILYLPKTFECSVEFNGVRKSKNNYPRGRLQRGNSSSKNVFIYTKEVYVTLWYCIVNIHDSSSDANFIPIWRIKALNEPLKLMKFILSYNFLNSKLIAALKDICQYFTISTIHNNLKQLTSLDKPLTGLLPLVS